MARPKVYAIPVAGATAVDVDGAGVGGRGSPHRDEWSRYQFCVTVNVCPPATMVPVRRVSTGATTKTTVPLPVPFPLPCMEIQSAVVVAVHGHPGSLAVSANELGPPSTPNVAEVGESVNAQPEACRRVTSWPATVIVPARAGPALATAVTPADPWPAPAGVATVIQGTDVEAVHGQEGPVATAKAAELARLEMSAAPGVTA